MIFRIAGLFIFLLAIKLYSQDDSDSSYFIPNNDENDYQSSYGSIVETEQKNELKAIHEISQDIQDDRQLCSCCNHLDPYEDFLYFKHRMQNKELLTFKTNKLLFNNELGGYCLQFILRKGLQPQSGLASIDQSGELLLDVDMRVPIAPYYTDLQKMKLTVFGVESKQCWSTSLSFNTREVRHTVRKCSRFSIRKNITNKDEVALGRIFELNRRVFFSLEGIEGVFEFSFDGETTYFYREFFQYAKKIGFY